MRWSVRRRVAIVRACQLLCALAFIQSLYDILPPRPSSTPQALRRTDKVFITSIHWNNERVLRDHWVPGIVELAKSLGPENVYVSVQESGSWDDSKGALRMLDSLLGDIGVRRTIILDETTHADEIAKAPGPSGWIKTARGKTELRRIPYLARLRNIALEPLSALAKAGERFDKVLFINDVVFSTSDVRRLLATRKGEYAAACSLDFAKPPQIYDTFALRDSEGHDLLMQTWPYFRSRASRHALKKNQPVPVTSCWNGIVAMDASPFYASQPLIFRGVNDSVAALHLEGSECCLVHADNPLSETKGVWLNPQVRVGYTAPAYAAVNRQSTLAITREVTAGSPIQHDSRTTFQLLAACWENRVRRWATSHAFREAVVNWRLGTAHTHEDGRPKADVACLTNEMQILVWNGWAHV